jgi:hypothetical protein
MLKKLFLTAAAAAAVSVTLAGVACADTPSDPSSNSNGIGAGGVPQKAGPVLESLGVGTGNPTPPGSLFKDSAKVPGMNTPDAYGALLDVLGQTLNPPATFGPTPPGMGVKSLTPGCSQGTTGGGHKICF